MRKYLVACIFAILCAVSAVSCGGGGGSGGGSYMPAPPTAARYGMFYGYYLTTSKEQALAQADHVNLIHEGNWFGLDATIESMQAHKLPTMLDLGGGIAYSSNQPVANVEESVTLAFEKMKAAGVLSQVVALYPVDEPEAYGLSDATVTEVNAAIHRAAVRFPEVAGVPLAVIYGTSRGLPGIASYDWIGADDYKLGSDILISSFWTGLMSNLQPNQRVFLVPGGVSPWQQNPEAFRRYAYIEPRVVGILPFLWHHPEQGHEGEGIDSNGMAPTYRALGLEITGKKQ